MKSLEMGVSVLVFLGLTGCSADVTSNTHNTQNNITSVSTVAKATVPVSISSESGNTEIAQAIKAYLQRVSDPVLFKSITILDVTAAGTSFGKEQWSVKLDIEHQTNEASAYNQGINYRFVLYAVNNNQFTVTGLATGMPTVNKNEYADTEFGFTVSIPTPWNNLCTEQSLTPTGGPALKVVDFDYAVEKTHPVILELVVYPKSYLEHLEQDPVVVKVFSNNKYSFAFYKGNEYPFPNSKNYAQYKELQNEIPWICSHFLVSSITY